jgi:hypothetical protein
MGTFVRISASILLVLLSAACSSDADGPTSSGLGDCDVFLRFQGTTYFGIGGANVALGEPLGDGEISDCSDTGASPEGVIFNGTKVAVYRVSGLPLRTAVGRGDSIYVAGVKSSADALPREIRELLATAPGDG